MNKRSSNLPVKKQSRLLADTPGQRIRKLREDEGSSQKKLAGLLGFTANYLGQVERDARPLSKNMADAICSYFHVDYNYLYHGLRTAQPIEHNKVQEDPAYDQDYRALLNEYIRNCSEDECRMLEPVIESLLHSLRKTGWFDQADKGQIKDES